jgi:hypothetical protein
LVTGDHQAAVLDIRYPRFPRLLSSLRIGQSDGQKAEFVQAQGLLRYQSRAHAAQEQWTITEDGKVDFNLKGLLFRATVEAKPLDRMSKNVIIG